MALLWSGLSLEAEPHQKLADPTGGLLTGTAYSPGACLYFSRIRECTV